MKLNVANLQFSYNSHPVLADVTFSLDQGQIMCVLGVNGAGKSTLLKCLNRILRPQRGSVWVDEERLRTYRSNSSIFFN
jgi:iron complex transport system ATP-binding protein